jgi:hypothetical protein
MIRLNKMEIVLEEKKHELLRELAIQQGVKPSATVSELYPAEKIEFDVDEYLKQIEEIRKSDKVKND